MRPRPDFDPDKIVQWGFEPQRDDLRQTGAYWKAGTLVADDGKTAQIPEAWAGGVELVLRGDLDGPPLDDRSAVPDTDFNPERLPVLHRQGRDEPELPLVDLRHRRLRATTGTWRPRPSYQGQTTAAFNADTFRILKSTKHPDEAFTVLQYLLDDAREELLKLYGAMPARPSETEAVLRHVPELDGR